MSRARTAPVGGPLRMSNPYDLIAEQWDARGHAFRQRRYVDLILEGLAPGARVLDVGCGTGRPVAEYLIARGFRVVGTGAERIVRAALEVLDSPRAANSAARVPPLWDGRAAERILDALLEADARRIRR